MSTLPRSALDTGQPSSACFVACSNAAWSSPATRPVTLSFDELIAKPPPMSSSETTAWTVSCSGGVPCCVRTFDSAMEYHYAFSAASSYSVTVLRSPDS